MRVTLPPRFWVHQAGADSGGQEARRWANHGLTVRMLRGHKMRSEGALIDEVGAALQFPLYFGENWDALDECIADVEWLPARLGYVMYVLRAREVLADEARDSLGVLVRVLETANNEWATEVALGEPWDRPAMPFRVVLQASRGPSDRPPSSGPVPWRQSSSSLDSLPLRGRSRSLRWSTVLGRTPPTSTTS